MLLSLSKAPYLPPHPLLLQPQQKPLHIICLPIVEGSREVRALPPPPPLFNWRIIDIHHAHVLRVSRLRQTKKGRSHITAHSHTTCPSKISPSSHGPPKRISYYLKGPNPSWWLSKTWHHTPPLLPENTTPFPLLHTSHWQFHSKGSFFFFICKMSIPFAKESLIEHWATRHTQSPFHFSEQIIAHLTICGFHTRASPPHIESL